MYTMSKKYSEDERLWTDWMRTVCVKDWGCVKDRSETVLLQYENIIRSEMLHGLLYIQSALIVSC